MEGSPSACRLPDRVTRAQITAATRREWTSPPMRGRFHPSGAPRSLAHRTRAVNEDRTLDQSEMLASAYRLTGPGYSRNQQGPILEGPFLTRAAHTLFADRAWHLPHPAAVATVVTRTTG
jgi:hypothetical protein